jgi:hypothetical protein
MVKISIELEVAEHEIPLATELLATLRCVARQRRQLLRALQEREPSLWGLGCACHAAGARSPARVPSRAHCHAARSEELWATRQNGGGERCSTRAPLCASRQGRNDADI